MSSRSSDMTIGALALATQSSVQTIRFYERIGLLPAPPRTAGGRRIYNESHLQRLNIVRRYRSFGFGITQVRILLDLLDQDLQSCSNARVIVREQRDQLRQKIAQAQALEHELSAYLDCCIADCSDDGPTIKISLQQILAHSTSC